MTLFVRADRAESLARPGRGGPARDRPEPRRRRKVRTFEGARGRKPRARAAERAGLRRLRAERLLLVVARASTACSRFSSPSGPRRSASASRSARSLARLAAIGRRRRAAPGRHRRGDRRRGVARCCCGRSARCCSASRRTTPRPMPPSWRCCERRGAGVVHARPPRRARRAAGRAAPGVTPVTASASACQSPPARPTRSDRG